MCQPAVPALVTRTESSGPRSVIWWANIFSAIGDRQMLPVHTKVMCSLESDTQRPPQLGDRRDVQGATGSAGVGEVGLTVTPAHDERVDAVGGGALDVLAAVADHEPPFGQRLQLRQSMREHVGLGGAGAVDAGSGDDLEVLVEAKMGQYALRGRLRLGGGHRQSDTGGPQIGQQWPDPVEEAVDRPTAGGVVGAVGGDGRARMV